MTHTIYIVDDNVSVREALIMLIEEEPDLAICGAADTAVEAIDVILRLQPDLVLTDYSLPGMGGIELIERLGVVRPGQPVGMLSAHVEPTYAEQAIAAGAKGYILKGDGETIISGIRRMLGGNAYVSPELRMPPPAPNKNAG